MGEASIDAAGEGVFVSVDEAEEAPVGEGVDDGAASQELPHTTQAASIAKSPGEVGKVVYWDA